MYAIYDLAQDRIGSSSYATEWDAVNAFIADDAECGLDTTKWTYRLQGQMVLAFPNDTGEECEGREVGYIYATVGEEPKAMTVSVYYLGDKWDHIENYADTNEAVRHMLEMAWEDPESVGFVVKCLTTGRILATLVTEEKFDDWDGIVAVMYMEGQANLTRYAVSYNLSNGNEGTYLGTNIRVL
jgi:hypothetical protein